MAFDRSSTEPRKEAASPGRAAARDRAAALRFQVLFAEHSGLLSSRSLAWNESFSRASMYLTALSGAIVALALVSQATGFGRNFFLFGLAILPVVLFIGAATFVRLAAANYHDAWCIVGMNRIRAAYLETVPDVARFLVTSPHDDIPGVGISAGQEPTRSLIQFLAATPAVVAILNAVVAAAIGSFLAGALELGATVALAIGAAAFTVVLGGHARVAARGIARAQAALAPMFPS